MKDTAHDRLQEDLAFFKSVHRLLDEQTGGEGRDRRRNARRSFTYVQLLAFYDGISPPGHADFRPVRCHDLSPGGFSFIVDERPEHSQVVVALGAVPFSFFLAKTQYVRRVKIGARATNQVGCRFIKRIATAADLG